MTEERRAVYGRLPAGNYRFIVEAKGADDVWASRAEGPEIFMPTPPWRTAWAFLLYGFLVISGLWWFVKTQQQKVEQGRALIDKQTKVLQGFLPMCAQCKSIREKNGDWTALEAYLDQHSEAVLSHGICPSCLKEL